MTRIHTVEDGPDDEDEDGFDEYCDDCGLHIDQCQCSAVDFDDDEDE